MSDSDYQVFTNKKSYSQLKNADQAQTRRAESKSSKKSDNESELEEWKLERQKFKESLLKITNKNSSEEEIKKEPKPVKEAPKTVPVETETPKSTSASKPKPKKILAKKSSITSNNIGGAAGKKKEPNLVVC